MFNYLMLNSIRLIGGRKLLTNYFDLILFNFIVLINLIGSLVYSLFCSCALLMSYVTYEISHRTTVLQLLNLDKYDYPVIAIKLLYLLFS